MSSLKTMEIEGKKIIILELAGDMEEEVKMIYEAKALIASQPEKSVRIITDISNANYDPKAVEELKAYTKHNTPYIKYSAVVGLTGMKKVFLYSIEKLTGRKFNLFDTIEEAKDWIVNQP